MITSKSADKKIMVKYTLAISKTAQKQLNKFTDKIAEPIIQVIQELSENPRPIGYKKLKGRDGYRIRKGNYRVSYDIATISLQ